MRRRPFSLRCTVMLYPHLAHFITPLSQLCAFARVSDLCVVRELILTAQEQFRGNKAMTIQYCKVMILILTQRPSPLKKSKNFTISVGELKHPLENLSISLDYPVCTARKQTFYYKRFLLD